MRLSELVVLAIAALYGVTESVETDGQNGLAVCNSTAEVVFVLDTSSSVGVTNFQHMKQFTQNVTARLKQEYERLNVTVITFSNDAKVEFALDSSVDIRDVLAAEENLTYTHGGTETHKALHLLYQSVFHNDVISPKIAILITDGASFEPQLTREAARTAKDAGVVIFVVGVGDDVNPHEIEAISSEPHEKYLYHLENFSALPSLVSVFHSQDCVPYFPTSTTATQERTVSTTESLIRTTEAPTITTQFTDTVTPVEIIPTHPPTFEQRTPTGKPGLVSGHSPSLQPDLITTVLSGHVTNQPPTAYVAEVSGKTLSVQPTKETTITTLESFSTERPDIESTMQYVTTTKHDPTITYTATDVATTMESHTTLVQTILTSTEAASTNEPSTPSTVELTEITEEPTTQTTELPTTSANSSETGITNSQFTRTTQPLTENPPSPVFTSEQITNTSGKPDVDTTLVSTTEEHSVPTAEMTVITKAVTEQERETTTKHDPTITYTATDVATAMESHTTLVQTILTSTEAASTNEPSTPSTVELTEITEEPTTQTTELPTTSANSSETGITNSQFTRTTQPLTETPPSPVFTSEQITNTSGKPDVDTTLVSTTEEHSVPTAEMTVITKAVTEQERETTETSMTATQRVEQTSPYQTELHTSTVRSKPTEVLSMHKPSITNSQVTPTTQLLTENPTYPIFTSEQITDTSGKPDVDTTLVSTTEEHSVPTAEMTVITKTVTELERETTETSMTATKQVVQATPYQTELETSTVRSKPTEVLTTDETTIESTITTVEPTTIELTRANTPGDFTTQVTASTEAYTHETAQMLHSSESTITTDGHTTIQFENSTESDLISSEHTTSTKEHEVSASLDSSVSASSLTISATEMPEVMSTTHSTMEPQVTTTFSTTRTSGNHASLDATTTTDITEPYVGKTDEFTTTTMEPDILTTTEYIVPTIYTDARTSLTTTVDEGQTTLESQSTTNGPDLHTSMIVTTEQNEITTQSPVTQGLVNSTNEEISKITTHTIATRTTEQQTYHTSAEPLETNTTLTVEPDTGSVPTAIATLEPETLPTVTPPPETLPTSQYATSTSPLENSSSVTYSETTIETTSTESPTTTTASCIAKVADVVFVVDSSGSIGITNFEKVKAFIKDVVKTFDVDAIYTRVGLIEYSTNPSIEFKLHDHDNMMELLDAIDNITYTGGGTSTSDALQLMRIEGFDRERPLAPDVAIVITDGLSKYPSITRVQANLAKGDGITIFSIGIGNGTSGSELLAIASGHRYVFEVGDFETLFTAHLDNVVAHTTCGVVLPEAYHTRATTPSTTTPAGCVDIDPQCASYPRDSCSDFEPWARKHCARKCGFCPGYPIVEPACEDQEAHCAQYGTAMCSSTVQYSWVDSHCRKFCGFCGNKTDITITSPSTTESTPANTTASGCVDTVTNCGQLEPGFCTGPQYSGWARSHCARFCGFCLVYELVTSVSVNQIKCPAWQLPVDCRLDYSATSCCPLPQCPDDFRLTVQRG